MNQHSTIALPSDAALDALQARFSLRVASHLDAGAESLPHDLTERLRFAREQALERARAASRRSASVQATAPAVVMQGGGLAAIGGGPDRAPRWFRFAAVLPALALVAGLFLIEDWNTRAQIDAAADIDSALLADDLPPDAYRDPGFVEYLKSAQE